MNHAPPSNRGPGSRGFTVVEVLIVAVILGTLAVVVVPHFSDASEPKRSAAVRDDLRYLRTQIMVYRAQHKGVAPGFPRGDSAAVPTYEAFVTQLTQPTDEAGGPVAGGSADHPLGPYLPRIPANPVNGSSAILFVPAGSPFPTAPSGPQGWVYQPSTGTIAANVPGTDAAGVDYFDY
jgi:general secretion pathway protein G